ncbi:hypothetical protein ACFSPU_12365 [Haoranjiania flava]|uniref:Iron uptake protein n=1 Tax=Haoranjiania flava TaxID=1856322 RepID=A0AAE3IP67_9BACT|nr:hypothetical protein [Haoranjiania flava]MCU7695574.1 hypothetical protein [Haoranjiania flava]
MPANKKYLTRSPWQRILKISAGFIGGYAVMISFHMLLAEFIDKKHIVITAAVTGYILWSLLLLLAFLAKNGWKVWGIYIALTMLFAAPLIFRNL